MTSSADSTGLYITVTGTDFAGDEDTTFLYVNGLEQDVYSFSTTEVVFLITDVYSIADFQGAMELYFEDGTPEGHEIIVAGVAVDPYYYLVSPNSGTYASTVVVMTIYGVGTSDADNILILNSNNNQPCTTTEILKYSQVRCTTKTATYADYAMVVRYDDVDTTCTNDDDTLCYYTQSVTDMPTVASITIDDATTMVITGEDFFTDYDGSVVYNGVEADSVSVDSDT